jgi:hypothetical protein
MAVLAEYYQPLAGVLHLHTQTGLDGTGKADNNKNVTNKIYIL